MVRAGRTVKNMEETTLATCKKLSGVLMIKYHSSGHMSVGGISCTNIVRVYQFYQRQQHVVTFKNLLMASTFSCVSFICLLAFACTKDKPPAVPAEVPVTKTIAYRVYAGTDYTASFYDNAKGQLELTIAKIFDNGSTTQVLWDTVFTWRNLAAYPTFQNKIDIVKEFSVQDSKEKIHVSYVRKYNFNGRVSQMAIGTPAPDGNAPVTYTVNM
jgi:hypothetical protein